MDYGTFNNSGGLASNTSTTTPQNMSFGTTNSVYTGLPPTSASINATTLTTPTQPLTLPPQTTIPISDISTLGNTTPTSTQTNSTNGTITPSTIEQPKAGVFSRLNNALQSVYQKTLGSDVQKQTAIDTATLPFEQQLNDINGQIKMHQANALANQENAINRVGGTTGSNSIAAQQVQRTDAIEAIKLSAIADSLQGNIALAEKKATNAVNAQFAQQKQDLDTARQNILDNYNSFTPAEKKRADATLLKLDAKDAFVAQQKEDGKTTLAFAAEAAKNGATSTVLNQITSAKSPMEALQIGAKYMSDPEDKAKALDQHNESIARQNKIYSDIANDKQTRKSALKVAGLDPNSTTFTIDSIKASAGGKIPTGEQTKPINKALLVTSQLDSIQSQIKNIDTGPIVGILKTANPYDVKAQLLKATLQATVPNLARGVYGEVGVLTDNDIANYTKTLPNIRSTKELSDLVLSMTLKVVKNSVDSNLQVLAAEGRDVSGFEPLYRRLEKQVNDIDGRIGVTKTTQGSDQYSSFRSQLQQGEILVNRGGKAVAVTQKELQASDIKL